MNKFLILLALTCLASALSFGQRNFQPGYIVLNNNDTVAGFIDYREWHKNPESLSFAKSKEGAVQKFTVKDAGSFEVTGKELYRRFFVNISMNDEFVNEMTSKDTSLRKDTVFLKVLFEGRHTKLFSYADEIKSRLFIASESETIPVELKNSEYMENGKIVSEKEYKALLAKLAGQYAPGNTDIVAKIAGTSNYKDDILEVLYLIDGKPSGKPLLDEKKGKKSAFRFWAGAGVGKNPINIEGENRYAGITEAGGISPVISAGFDIRFNPYIGKLFWRTELAFTTAKTNAYVSKQYFASKENYYLDLKFNSISLNETINYNFYNSADLKIFLGAGVGFNFSSLPLNRETFVREASTDTSTSVNNNYLAYLNNFFLNGIVRTGVTIKNIEASIAYTTKGTFSDYASFSANVSSLRLQVNYLFGK
ncbi:MAG TPA: hypothetical protein PKM63_00060 [Panacibacter sp.]|nr:hypothetical protein [Panacibacter sp.]HNP42642.1 hypothetical protein [Panacibacter sp.]